VLPAVSHLPEGGRSRARTLESGSVRQQPEQHGGFRAAGDVARPGTCRGARSGIPGDVVHETVNAFVVHVAPGRGIGVQFIGASEAFKSRLEEYLAQLSR